MLSYPREMDPRVLGWKGGAVFARLESVRETWVSRYEWKAYRTALLKERLLFPWQE